MNRHTNLVYTQVRIRRDYLETILPSTATTKDITQKLLFLYQQLRSITPNDPFPPP